MLYRSSIGAIAFAVALTVIAAGARADDDMGYPNWGGQWSRADTAQFDPTRPPGLAQQAPFTEEYLARFKAIQADREIGGLEANHTARCLPAGMPRAMIVYETMEIIITPEITYVYLSLMNEFRRIHTDGRDWPAQLVPAFTGTSIGRWETGADGKYDALVVETRGINGPRSYEGDGLPLHDDNQTIVKERFYADKANPALLHNEITTIDHALTRPWTVTRTYKHAETPYWSEYVCAEDNAEIVLRGENYYLSAEGKLMPTRKGQPSPDLRFFEQTAP